MGEQWVFDGLSNLAIFLLKQLNIFSVIRQDNSEELATISVLVYALGASVQTQLCCLLASHWLKY